MSTRTATSQPSPPTEQALREAALRHLARYAATEQRLRQVLERRVDRWLRAARDAAPEDDGLASAAAQSRDAAARVVAALAASRIVDDAAYAQGRAASLRRAGKSRAKVAQHLTQRGIDTAMARAAAQGDDAQELGAALLLARKRRLGPFARDGALDLAKRRRALGILARAGFSHATASRALATPADEAEQWIERLRRG